MLKRRLIGTAVLGASIALASWAVVHTRSGPSESAQLTVSNRAGTPPPFPASVVGGPLPPSSTTIKTGVPGRSGTCTQQSTHWTVGVDFIAKETTVSQLAAESDEIVVADTVRQVGYWQKVDDTWQPWTMTEYHVTNQVKGTAGPWLQVGDFGASSDLMPTCKNLAFTVANEPVPTSPEEYVLFLRADPQTGKLIADTMRRFPVNRAVMHTSGTPSAIPARSLSLASIVRPGALR
jgi:hypothetical protein